MDTTTNQLFTLLFVHGEPISQAELCSLLHINEEQLKAHVDAITRAIAELPISLTYAREGYSLVTNPDQGEFLKTVKTSMSQSPLSKAALETLTLIAYNNGATKAFIDSVRGVNSTLSLRNLVMRGLIEKVDSSDGVCYNITSDTLRHLGINDITQLPDYEAFLHERQNWNMVDGQ